MREYLYEVSCRALLRVVYVDPRVRFSVPEDFLLSALIRSVRDSVGYFSRVSCLLPGIFASDIARIVLTRISWRPSRLHFLYLQFVVRVHMWMGSPGYGFGVAPTVDVM